MTVSEPDSADRGLIRPPRNPNRLDVAAVGIVVPVRNEAELLPACLRSLAVAVREVPVPVRIVVALDRCTDASPGVVERSRQAGLPVRAVVSDRPGVGAARAAGLRALIEDAPAGVPSGRLWLASTDADSEVAPYWLTRQLAHAARGAEVVVGTVRVADWSGQPPGVAERHAGAYRAEHGHRHLHGANLGFTAARYLAVGGFAELTHDEDVDLVSRLEAAGSAMVWAADLPVTTSARRVGRAPAGFAGYLAGLARLCSVDPPPVEQAEVTDALG